MSEAGAERAATAATTTGEETTGEETAEEATTAEPATGGPTTQEPTTGGETAQEATTAEPTTGEPAARQPGARDGARTGATPDGAGSTPAPRRRQARGEARIAQLLAAAADVFRTQGYTAATTNAIAREAGVSPGTLYQFFPNKEAIAVELGDRLLRRWQETYGEAITPSHSELALDRLLDTVLDPLIAFNTENPAFCVLMRGGEVPGRITENHDLVHEAMLTRVEALLAGYLPELPDARIQRVGTMSFQLFKAGLDLIMTHEGEEREAYARELKTVMFRYLNPLLDEANRLSRAPDSA